MSLSLLRISENSKGLFIKHCLVCTIGNNRLMQILILNVAKLDEVRDGVRRRRRKVELQKFEARHNSLDLASGSSNSYQKFTMFPFIMFHTLKKQNRKCSKSTGSDLYFKAVRQQRQQEGKRHSEFYVNPF